MPIEFDPNKPAAPYLTPKQIATNKARWWEDLVSTGKIGLVIIPALALVKYSLPNLPWGLIEDLLFAVLGVMGVAVVSAHSTKKRHREAAAKAATEATMRGK